MRLFLALGLCLLAGAAAAASRLVTIAEVAVVSLPGWSAAAVRPSHPQLLALTSDPVVAGVRARASRLLGFSRGSERAAVLYLEYASEREAQRALGELRGKLWGGEGPSLEAPRLLRASNVVAAVEAPTLSVTLQVSRRLAAAGAVQDGADVGSSPEEPAAGPTELPPPLELPSAGAQAQDVQLQGQVAAALGRHLERSGRCGQALRDKRYAEALSCYRSFQQEVEADGAASDLARWDAYSGVGLAAAYGGQMAEAREAFLQALRPAVKLDPRKLAETYFNFACAEAELGRKAAALQALKACLAAARRAGPERLQHFRQSIQTDASLRSLRGDPRLKKLLLGK